MTVSELLARVSSRELSEWMAYAELEPFGSPRSDRLEALAGQELTLLANVNRDPKKKSAPYRIEEFMPWLEIRKPAQSWQEQLAIAEMLNSLFGGDDRRTL